MNREPIPKSHFRAYYKIEAHGIMFIVNRLSWEYRGMAGGVGWVETEDQRFDNEPDAIRHCDALNKQYNCFAPKPGEEYDFNTK